MTPKYKHAPENNNEADLADFTVQPASQGIQYARYVVSPGGSKVGKGDPFAILRWSGIDEDQFEQILAQAEVTEVILSAPCTVRARILGSVFAIRNATISWEPGKAKREFSLYGGFEMTLSRIRRIAS